MDLRTEILYEDFENVIKQDVSLDRFRGKSFLVTGSTGLIGSLFVRFLLYCNAKYRLNATVYAMIRNEEKARNIFSGWMQNEASDKLNFYTHELGATQPIDLPHVDYIVHAAAITQSKMMIEKPVETIKTSVNGTEEILDFALKTKATSVLYVSSMEAYGTMSGSGMTTEDELGFVNLSNVRSCYPESKRMCEMLCNAYAAEYEIDVKSVRLAQTFGAGILEGENRVFAQFARSVINGENIVLHTEGKSEGNYVYTSDAIAAIVMLLNKGNAGEAYNVVNEESHTTIRGMAEMVAEQVADGQIEAVVEIPENAANLGYAPETKLHLSSKKLRSLGWKSEVGLLAAYHRTIAYMKG